MDIWEREMLPSFEYKIINKSKDIVSSLYKLNIFQDKTKCNGNRNVPSHGHCVWDASIVLSHYFQFHKETLLRNLKKSSIIELGAGIGLVGMTLAMLGAKSVLLTDQDYCLELIAYNINQNFKLIKNIIPPKVKELQWGMNKINEKYDIIVGSDIVYNLNCIPLLISTICLLCHKETEIYICYEYRNTEIENRFNELLHSNFNIVKKINLKKDCSNTFFINLKNYNINEQDVIENIIIVYCSGMKTK